MGGYLYILNILPDTVEEEMTSSYFVKAFWMQYYNRKLNYQIKLTRQLSYQCVQCIVFKYSQTIAFFSVIIM